jgi:hypothetical protein
MADVSFSVGAVDQAGKVIQQIRDQLQGMGRQAEQIAAQQTALNTNTAASYQKLGASIKNSFTELNSAFMLIQRGAAAVKQVIDATVGAFVTYANQVRTISQISGESAQATSVLIQVTDDYKLGTDDLMTAQRKLATQGYSLNIETIAKLSDEYRKLNSGAERQQFLTDNLGRSSAAWAEVMSQGSEAILARSDAVNKGLILDQAALDSARQYELALDDLNDQIQAIKVSAGQTALPLLTHLMKFSQTSWGEGGWGQLPLFLNNVSTKFREKYGPGTLGYYLANLANIPANIAGSVQGYLGMGETPTPQPAIPQSILDITNLIERRDAIREWREEIDKVPPSLDDLNAAMERDKATTAGYTAILSGSAPDVKKMAVSFLQAQLASDGLLDSMDASAVLGFAESLGTVDAKTADAMASAIKFQVALDELKATAAAGGFDITAQMIIDVAAKAGVSVGAGTGIIPEWLPAGTVGGADTRPMWYNKDTGQFSMSGDGFVPYVPLPVGGVEPVTIPAVVPVTVVSTVEGNVVTGVNAPAVPTLPPEAVAQYTTGAGTIEGATEGLTAGFMDAAAQASALVAAILKIPPDFSRIYDMQFNITTTRQGNWAGGWLPSMAAGGAVGPGAFVGDAPGGRPTPYMEFVERLGTDRYYVHSAPETRQMMAAGQISMSGGGMMANGGTFSSPPPANSNQNSTALLDEMRALRDDIIVRFPQAIRDAVQQIIT